MSKDAIFANLPRFDEAHLVRLKLPLESEPQSFDAPEPPESAFPDIEEADEVPFELTPEPVPAPASEPPVDFSMLEDTVAALSGAIATIEREAQTRMSRAIEDMVRKLFPELARRFLAEEIGLHLKTLLPVSINKIEIRAAPAMVEALTEIVRTSEPLSDRCTVVAEETGDAAHVEVSWRSGGLTFDYTGLMEACLARLDGTQAETRA